MQAVYLAVIYLFCLGLYCVVTERNLIKIAIGFVIMEAGILLFLVCLASFPDGMPPILIEGATSATMVDPIPHALSLTAIVIGAGTTGYMLSLIIRLYRQVGTVRIDRMRRTEQ